MNFLHFSIFKINKKNNSSRCGMSIVEAIIGVAVFAIIAVGVYSAFLKIFDMVKVSHAKILAVALANEQFEIIRNLPYSNVGLLNGIPVGILSHTRTVTRDSIDFVITTTIRNVDDPFDGTFTGTPKDSSPADYKSVDVDIDCSSCKNFQTVSFTTFVSPKNLETTSNNGALIIKVFDANGLPVSGANVHIENRERIPNIIIDDVTNVNGSLLIVDVPPGEEDYAISVSKSGYSSERTYANGTLGNPLPVKPNATVAIQQVTQISFAIDKVSKLNIASVTETCQPVIDVPFRLTGNKIIGLPSVKKFDQSFSTGSSGLKSVENLEWDTYSVSVSDSSRDLLGVNPSFPLSLSPNETKEVQFVLTPKDPISLLVTVKDSVTGLPLSGATVRLEKEGIDSSKVSGRGFLSQTDWSGGSGQENFSEANKYFSDDGSVNVSVSGEARLSDLGGGDYSSSGSLISSSFDVGSPSNFYEISWLPETQPIETGENPVKFQIATNLDNSTWNFKGPDGTSGTYYTLLNKSINSIHNGDRYFRYKAFLSTETSTTTPSLSDVSFIFTSSCVPPGQVRFGGLSSGHYDLSVSKTGYGSFSENINITSSGSKEVILLSQ